MHTPPARRLDISISCPPVAASSSATAESVKIPIALPKQQYEWLREFAFRRRIPMAGVVREALREHRHRTEPTPSGSPGSG
jgi:hypothetical protein